MIVFLKRHKISIGLLILSMIIGFVVYMKVSPVDIWRIEYEFKSSEEAKLPKFAQVDTVFQYDDIVCRNMTGSIADTLVKEGIRRYELKVYLKQPSDKGATRISEELFVSPYANVINHRFRETQRDKRSLLYWTLFGFFLGMMVELIIALKKKPSAN